MECVLNSSNKVLCYLVNPNEKQLVRGVIIVGQLKGKILRPYLLGIRDVNQTKIANQSARRIFNEIRNFARPLK